VASVGQADGLSALIAAPGELPAEDLRATLQAAGLAVAELAEVGSHAARFRVN
jgi:hypothetical protein